MPSMSLRIRQARSMARLTQAQLAKLVGVKRSAVAQWEQVDGTSPCVSHLADVASTTGVYFEWLATGRGTSRPDPHEFQTAAISQDFAQDESESRALEALRRVPRNRRNLALSILELLGS